MNREHACAFTLLPPLEIREDADGNVESLDHYIARLAHCAGLALPAVGRMLTRSPLPPGPTLHTRDNRSAWIGPGDRVQETVERLRMATGLPDLHRGTFLHVTPGLSGIGFANCDYSANARKWCPSCYSEWDHDYSFEPLYWSFGALANCPIHKCQMLSRCPHCGCRQRHGASYARRRDCRSCRGPLGFTAQIVDMPQYQSWVDRQCVLTALAASSTGRPITPDCFDRYFQRVLWRWSEGEPVPAYVKASMKNLETRWKNGERQLKPTFVQYLNFASFHGTTVDEIMLSPETAAAEPLVEGARKSFTQFTLRRPLKETLRRLMETFSHLLASDIPHLPTAAAVCAFFEVDFSYARDRMRDIVDAYSEALRKQGRDHSKQSLRRAYSCALYAAQDEAANPPRESFDTNVPLVASRARCSPDLAKSACRAAAITLSVR